MTSLFQERLWGIAYVLVLKGIFEYFLPKQLNFPSEYIVTTIRGLCDQMHKFVLLLKMKNHIGIEDEVNEIIL